MCCSDHTKCEHSNQTWEDANRLRYRRDSIALLLDL